jgi:hypothetical protein
MTAKLKKLLLVSSCATAAVAVLCGLYVRAHPLVFNESFLGHAHCMKGGGLALDSYARGHYGKFPYHTNGYGDALLLMTNEVGVWWASVTGPGYTEQPFLNALATGSHLAEQACGRVYVQGLSVTDNPEITLLFDKLPTPGGDHCHLLRRLSAPLGREVWTIGSGMRFVPESKWPAYSKEQVELLAAAGIAREKAEMYYSEKSKK